MKDREQRGTRPERCRKEKNMSNSISSYTDSQIMKALLTRNFSEIGRRFEDDQITNIKAAAFFNANNLDEVVLPAVTTIGPRAFQESGLSTLSLTWGEITSIGSNAFHLGFNALPQSLTLPKLTALGYGVFTGTEETKNTRLTSISMPLWTGSSPTETGIVSIMDGAFEYCSALTSVNLPELQTIRSNTFRYCSALEEVKLPKVTGISNGAFAYCIHLRKLEIGGAIKSITTAFLTGTSAFEALILSGITTVPTLSSAAFNNTSIGGGTAYVYVPRAYENTIKVSTTWSNYANQIRSIEDYPDVCNL